MMTDTTYNGWTNYETWLTNLHFDWLDFTDFVKDGYLDDLKTREDVKSWIAEFIEEQATEVVFMPFDECATSNVFLVDVINSFLQEVNWRELADHYIDDVMEAIEERSKDA